MKDKLKLKSTRGGIERRWRRVKDWESRSETWLYPVIETPIWLFGCFAWGHLILRLTWDPTGDAGSTNLGSVLGAQAAMTAIFLAAMIFIVEAVQRREGLDDPLYELFLSKSWARWIFATAVWLLIGTALLYLFGPITGLLDALADARGDVLGISSLILAAGLILLFLLRALDVLRPEQYRKFRRDAVLEQVRRGVRSQVQARDSQLGTEEVRYLLGVRNEIETRAARAIERVVDQTYQAVERTQLTEIREGIALLEEICKVIAAELEEGEDERPEISTFDDGEWLGHDNILAGMQRFVRAAANEIAHESILRAIFHADVERTQTITSTPYRLRENIRTHNELFVQVMIECIELEPKSVARLADARRTAIFEEPLTEMLSDALRNALSRSDAVPEGSRRHRIALRVIKLIHEFAGSYALKREEERACALLEHSFLRHASDGFPTVEEELVDEDPIRSALRQAVISGIGYGVGIGNDDFLDNARDSKVVNKLIETGQMHQPHVVLERDFAQQFGRESVLGGGPYRLTRGLRSFSGSMFDVWQATELEFQQARAECVVLGYMWLLGLIHKGVGEVVLPSEVQPEFNRVWHLYSGRLVSALRRAGIGEGRDLWSWGEAAFSVGRG